MAQSPMPSPNLMILIGLVAAAISACDRQTASMDAPAATAPPATVSLETAVPAVPVAAMPPSAPTTAPQYNSQQQPIISETARIEKPRQVGIHTPPRGSGERVALMNALRPVVRAELGGDVIFIVNDLRSNGEWAFASLEPTWPDGRRINPATTPISRQTELLDGLRTEAIWRKERGRWQVFAHGIGSTDVWWLDHCGRVPRGLMPGC